MNTPVWSRPKINQANAATIVRIFKFRACDSAKDLFQDQHYKGVIYWGVSEMDFVFILKRLPCFVCSAWLHAATRGRLSCGSQDCRRCGGANILSERTENRGELATLYHTFYHQIFCEANIAKPSWMSNEILEQSHNNHDDRRHFFIAQKNIRGSAAWNCSKVYLIAISDILCKFWWDIKNQLHAFSKKF